MSTNSGNEQSSDCEALLDLIPEYAFGLTDRDETRSVEANLQRCPEAVARLQEYQRLQEEMRVSVPQIDPPPQVGARLMAAISMPAAAPPKRRPIRLAWAIAAAAVLALAVTNAYWLTRVADLTQSHDLITALVNSQNTAFIVASTNALHWVRLADTQTQGSAAAFMMWNSQSKIGLLYAHALPTLQPGQTYHLWLTRGDERISVGTIQLDANGDGALLFTSPVEIDHYTWAHVSADPDTGATPTSPPVVAGALSS